MALAVEEVVGLGVVKEVLSTAVGTVGGGDVTAYQLAAGGVQEEDTLEEFGVY